MLRDESCKNCALSAKCRSVCLMPEEQYGDLMVVSDNPTFAEESDNEFRGSKNKLLRDVITVAMKADMSKVYMTSAVKCYSGDKKPSKKEITACKPYLLDEIAVIKPKAILLLGDVAMRTLIDVGTLTQNRGKVNMMTFFDELEEPFEVPVIVSFASGYAEYNDSHLKSFAEDVYKAYSLSQGAEPEEKKISRVRHLTTLAEVEEVLEVVKNVGICSFDYETSEIKDKGLGVHDPDFKVTLISLSYQHGSSYTIPIDHIESPFSFEEQSIIWDRFFTVILENEEVHKIAHNAKFEMAVSALFGCTGIRGRLDDTMLMHHLYDETQPHGLKTIVKTFYPDFADYEDEIKQQASAVGWENIPMNILSPYGGTDADVTLRLRDLLESFLLADEKIYRIYRNLTMYLNRALFKAEFEGMLINKDALITGMRRAEHLISEQETKLRSYSIVQRFEIKKTEKVNYEKRIELEDKIAVLQEKYDAQVLKAGKAGNKQLVDGKHKLNELVLGISDYSAPINFGSPVQLGELLYGKDGFNYPEVYDRKKKMVCRSTDKNVMDLLEDDTGFIADLKLYRSLSKTYSTYLLGIYDRLDKNDRLHTSFLIHGTTSGRLSSRNPNLQNLPNASKLKDESAIELVAIVKSVFVPPTGHYIVQLDYSQAELRLIAEFAVEHTMIKAYDAGQDLHALTASKFVGVALEEFMLLPDGEKKKWRTNAKAGNFGLIYGMSAEGLVEYARTNYGLTLTLDQATQWRDDFFELYPALLYYHDLYIEKARKFGYVRTLFGRKRHTPNIHSTDPRERAEDERVAINSPIQGTAGEFTEFALALLSDRLDPRVKIVNTVHDSIILYVPFELMRSTMRLARMTCTDLPIEQYFGKKLNHVRMEVDIEYSKESWKAMQPYEEVA